MLASLNEKPFRTIVLDVRRRGLKVAGEVRGIGDARVGRVGKSLIVTVNGSNAPDVSE